jgi:AcrR family transcriptional regulator
MATRSRRLEPRRHARRGQGSARRRGRPPGRASGGETRDRIIDAAVKIFAERGYGSTSVRDIAERARIRVSTLYHYFRSKDDMYAEVQRRVDTAVRDIVVSCLDEDLEFRDFVRQLIERLFDFLLAHRDEARLAFEGSLNHIEGSEPASAQKWMGLAEAVIRPAAAKGLLKEIDPALFIISMDGLLHWHVVNEAAYRRNLGRDLSDVETAARAKRHIVQLTLRGLGVE